MLTWHAAACLPFTFNLYLKIIIVFYLFKIPSFVNRVQKLSKVILNYFFLGSLGDVTATLHFLKISTSLQFPEDLSRENQ